jgi:hypothetical protein
VPIAPRRRWQIAVGAATLVAAAAIAIVVLRPKPPANKQEHVALVLPAKRSLEVRFSGEQLGKHRPYEPAADRAHEAIDVRALADLDPRDRVGALAASGELVRASELARSLPQDASSLSDLAALALANGDAESALDLAARALARDAASAPAAWNFALAARRLQLFQVSRARFATVVSRAEPGWAAEARQHIELLDRELARGRDIERLHEQFKRLVKAGSVRGVVLDAELQRNADEFQLISRSILEDETPIVLDLVRRFPSHAWSFLHESLAVATPELVEGLAPVARELDRISASKLPTTTLTKRADPFAALASDAGDALPEQCKNDIYALPCVPLTWRIARQQLTAGKLDDAEQTAQLGRDLASRENLVTDYTLLAEIHRALGRHALAAAELEEQKLARP